MNNMNDIEYVERFILICKALEFKYSDLINNLAEHETLAEYLCIEQIGGESQGNRYHFVLHFPERDIYARWDGYYESYDGVDIDLDNFRIVKPMEKTITYYE